MSVLAGLFAGLLFGVGLVISGMTDPAKVIAFLDVAGEFDPSLAFVLAGATVTTFIGYRMVEAKSAEPLLAQKAELPQTGNVDRRLIGGAALFGLGWGIGGYCPGPALTAVGLLAPGTLVFVVAMVAGVGLALWFTGSRPPHFQWRRTEA